MIEIIRGDITELAVDAIVNAANAALCGGGGVDGAIHDAAGPELLAACRKQGGCSPGHAVLTPGFNLPARFVIHAVGPVWSGGTRDEEDILAATYRAAFAAARQHGMISSIAFPCISTGAYRFPRTLAAQVALAAMQENVDNFARIVACVFDVADEKLYRATMASQRVGRPNRS